MARDETGPAGGDVADVSDPVRRRTLAWRGVLMSGFVIVVCAVAMISGYLVDVARAPAAKSRIDALVEQVKTDHEIAEALADERERQTEASLARKVLNRSLAWVLLVSGVLFVACGKRFASLRPQASPALDELVAVRFPPTPLRNGRQPDRPSATSGDGQEPPDLSFVDQLVARTGRGREAAIPILQAIQTHYRYLPDEALQRVCQLTEVTPAQIAGTSSFYAQFRRGPVGRHVVRVCHGTACHVAGAGQISQELRRHLEIPHDADTDPRRLFTIDAVACVGCCSLAPVMMIEDETAGRLTPATARQTLDALEPRT